MKEKTVPRQHRIGRKGFQMRRNLTISRERLRTTPTTRTTNNKASDEPVGFGRPECSRHDTVFRPLVLGIGSAILLMLPLTCYAQTDDQNFRWPAPELNDDNLDRWLAFIRPSEDDLKWRRMRWHRELEDAAKEAEKLHRPILLWTMNGHPCGET